MKLGMLDTRVARRILLLFAVGAALPVGTMTALTYGASARQLRQQGEVQLQQLAGVSGQSVLERLSTLTSLARATASLALLDQPPVRDREPLTPPPGIRGIVIQEQGAITPVVGLVDIVPQVSPDLRDRLHTGLPVLTTEASASDGTLLVHIGIPLHDPEDEPAVIAWAEILGDSIWSPAVTLTSGPAITDVCVLDGAGRALFCSAGPSSQLPELASPVLRAGRASGLGSTGGDADLLFVWRDLFLRSAFGIDAWTIVLAEPRVSVYSAASTLRYNLGLASLIGLSGVLLLSNVLVRRTMEPLRALTAGTRRLAQRDLETRVVVESDDEFGDLATSFNRMAERLDLQFKQLEAGQAIDRSAMSGSDLEESVTALTAGVASVVPGASLAVLLAEPGTNGPCTLYVPRDDARQLSRTIAVGDAALRIANAVPREPKVIEAAEEAPEPFRALVSGPEGLPMLVLPLRDEDRVIGAMAVTSGPNAQVTEADRYRAQRLVDRAAVAIAKVRLDRDLASMSWEALSALANAIDAKSPWTTGHSERVTELSLLLGGELGLSPQERDVLHRGGLLHDIGKIAVPTAILDFDGPLDAEMRARVQEHPAAGERILAPIRMFQPILPIVRSHHEWWDGRGYPDGLRREEIHPMARLLAVADVFDAMVSARPYRPGLDPELVHNRIREASGTQFDPEMVEALDRLLARGWSAGVREKVT